MYIKTDKCEKSGPSREKNLLGYCLNCTILQTIITQVIVLKIVTYQLGLGIFINELD